MENSFKNLVKSRFPYLIQGKLLLAVSGGVDSVVLSHLCKAAHLEFSMAHCNFNLRGDESDGDEAFVTDLADLLEVEVFTESFDTEKYAKDHGLSIQMAARELRYGWFEELSKAFHFDYILTAHHANDNLETFLINLVRGTGLEGFTGIKAENNQIIRPLLEFSRKEIEDYAIGHKISWREDSSNASSKYIRNRIRHDVIPVLEELNPQLLQGFAQTEAHLQENQDLIDDYVSLLYPKVVTKDQYGYNLDVSFLKKLPHPKAVLYQLLKSFGFTEWNDVYNLLEAQTGKFVFSGTHRLIKDRDRLILTELRPENNHSTYRIEEGEELVMLPPGTFHLEEVKEIKEKHQHCIYVAKEKLEFPLILRKWKKGDSFYPFGMKGKKKLSDFYKDKKLSLPEKENSWLLCSGGKIVWAVNQRADDRFAVTSPDQKILKITCNQ